MMNDTQNDTIEDIDEEPPAASRNRNPFIDDPDRPIYAIGKLMQHLPDDITNITGLTPEQAQMAAAVAHYADIVYDTDIDGIAEIGKLMHKAGSECPVSVSALGRLIQHLSYEAQFMQQAAQDYRDAAEQVFIGK